ncbi:MAG TPA: hypothetical protein VGP68_01755 [Gemmataceae bacterium]|jgi:hypothetical protein|nr:hypothetical protein [Gemmataceae bacterium]
MTNPSGKIIGRPMKARACGHQQEFQEYSVDKYRAQRLAKFQQTRCPECAAKFVAEQQAAALAQPKKGEVLGVLPTGTQIAMSRKPDGSWAGSLTANGISVEFVGTTSAGPQSIVVALARLWFTKSGASGEGTET